MKPRLILPCVLILAALSGSCAAAEKIKVLIITGGHGFNREAFFQVFQDNPEITFTAAEHAKESATAYERDDLANYDVVVLYDMPTVVTDVQQAKFRSLFARGIGLVVLHHALVAPPIRADYERIIGGRYPTEPGAADVGYQHDVDIPVVVVARDHPVTSGVTDFTIRDEIYWGFRVRPDVTPLLTTTHPKSGNPIAWCRTEEKSRVVYLQLGHGPSAFENPNYRRLVANCIRWAARR